MALKPKMFGRGLVRGAVDTMEMGDQPKTLGQDPAFECSTGIISMCARVAPWLLAHLNVMLSMFAGGALVTAARLKWDPSTYVAVRLLLPEEYRVLAGVLSAGGLALALAAHLGLVAVATRRASVRRLLLLMYAALMTALAVVELALCGWMVRRLLAWYTGIWPFHMLLKTIVAILEKTISITKEVEGDLIANLWVVVVSGAVAGVAQAAAVLLALALALCSPRARR